MSDAKTLRSMSPGLEKVAERAKRHPDQRILALAHLIDESALERAFGSLRRNAAKGIDGVTVEQYGEQLAANVRGLRARMKAGQYRHQPILRVNLPKEDGSTRPIGISTVEDKIVQGRLIDSLRGLGPKGALAIPVLVRLVDRTNEVSMFAMVALASVDPDNTEFQSAVGMYRANEITTVLVSDF